MEKKEKKLLNWQEACMLLGCKKSHFYNLVNAGLLPSQRSGIVRGVRVRTEDCLEYLRYREAQ